MLNTSTKNISKTTSPLFPHKPFVVGNEPSFVQLYNSARAHKASAAALYSRNKLHGGAAVT